jgi:NADPH:quinone reductase-like Zn-dependent oxidoreductase
MLDSLEKTMKAIVFTQYGSPDVLQLVEIEKPTPKENEVLVKVHASSANAVDWRFMRANPFFTRFELGLLKPSQTRLGADVAGRVEAVGSAVTGFIPGDEVFGDVSGYGLGCFSEYVAFPEDAFAHKPADITFEEAAATPVTAITALQGLRDAGKIEFGQKVLINGASGGVGTFAVQIAKAFGATATAVCSTKKMETARLLGADHVIDYTRQDFTREGEGYDLIFDIVANRSAVDYRRALNPGGLCVVCGFKMGHMVFQVGLLGSLLSMVGDKKIVHMMSAEANQKDMLVIQDLLESGSIAPVIDRTYPLSETAEAIRYLDAGHARGKVVIIVAT